RAHTEFERALCAGQYDHADTDERRMVGAPAPAAYPGDQDQPARRSHERRASESGRVLRTHGSSGFGALFLDEAAAALRKNARQHPAPCAAARRAQSRTAAGRRARISKSTCFSVKRVARLRKREALSGAYIRNSQCPAIRRRTPRQRT